MAEKIKFRLTAAKVSVSVALLALAGGALERFRSGPSEVHITPASSPNFLKLGGITGNVKTALIKLEDKWIKLDTALAGVVHKMATEYLKIDKANTEFLKVQKAYATFLKTDKANAEFLKIQKANAEFLKIQKANAEFLKIQKANAEFLKIQAAQNEFIQGQGGVVSAATPVTADGSVTKLFSSPDGSLTVSLLGSSPGADFLTVRIDNNTGALLPAVLTADGLPGSNQGSPQTVSQDLKQGENLIQLIGFSSPHQLRLQTFGDGSSNTAITLTLSTEGTGNTIHAVGQMLLGNL
jgi:hypothetical protein